MDALIDATHPFAGTISFHAARAAAAAHVPLLALRRPGWVPADGDDWHAVGSLAEAAALLPGARPAGLPHHRPHGPGRLRGTWTTCGSSCGPSTPPEAPHPARMEVLLDRGPFTLDGERELLRRHRIDVVVTKDSGGAATAPKLTAAREAGLPVVVVRRPPVPEGVTVATDPEAAARWVDERLAAR